MKKFLFAIITLSFCFTCYAAIAATACQAQLNKQNTICAKYAQAKSQPNTKSQACRAKAKAAATRRCRNRPARSQAQCIKTMYSRALRRYCRSSRGSSSSLRNSCNRAKKAYRRCKQRSSQSNRFSRHTKQTRTSTTNKCQNLSNAVKAARNKYMAIRCGMSDRAARAQCRTNRSALYKQYRATYSKYNACRRGR